MSDSLIFWSAFSGSAVGLPVGFLLINVIKLIQSKMESQGDEQSDHLEWAITCRGSLIVAETQVANNWVRIFNLRNLLTLDDEGNDTPIVDNGGVHVPYVVQAVGGAGSPPPVPCETLDYAHMVYNEAISEIRLRIGLPPQ